MKKETFTEKLIKRTYGISGPLDEYKRREADRIGNQVFIILFYLMIFGNLIPLLLAYKYPQEVALIYPPLILVIALIAAGYVTYQMKKTGITVIEPDMLNEKERKQATTLPRS
ncbi:membrane protein [Streptococcus pneumoniae]|nr:membrane protein [Streptococcus pneumoniae]VRB88589.1 membrane protein [Streptococcus pneumoniae]